MQRQRGNSPSR